LINKVKARDCFLILVLLSVSRFPFLGNLDIYIIIISSIILLNELTIGFRSLLNSKKFLFWISLLIIIFSIHQYNLGLISIPASINFILKILIAFYFAKLIGINFKYRYFDVIYVFSFISIFGYLLNILGFNLGFEIGRHYSLIFYDSLIEPGDIIRNNGPFWEPGAFAGYIAISFLLFIEEPSYILKNKQKSIIILIALITTFSTMGYLVVVLLIFLLLTKNTKKLKLLLILPFFIIGSFYLTTLDFIGLKVNEQFEEAIESDENKILFSRFGSVVIDYYYFKKNPLTGNGLPMQTRYSDHIDIFEEEDLGGFGNGFSSFIASFGILFVIIFFIAAANNLYKSRKNKIYFVLILTLILFGEQFQNFPFFWALLFINENSSFNYSTQ